MKRHRHLFSLLCSFDNLKAAYKKARKGKTTKWYVISFEENLENELFKLQWELLTKTYAPKPLKNFIVRDPKTRKISASDFRDRVIHHALVNIIEPILERQFIYDSFANRKGKGTKAALERFDFFMRKVSKNGRRIHGAYDANQICGYALKADIYHYFENIDWQILIKILEESIDDKEVIWLIGIILKNHAAKEDGKGMPLGNLTSQFLANAAHIIVPKHFLREYSKSVAIGLWKK